MAGEPASRTAKEQLTDRAAPALVVSHLTKCFGDRSAFEDVSFEVAHGEVFGFLGPNGAGKTTTVRTLVVCRLNNMVVCGGASHHRRGASAHRFAT